MNRDVTNSALPDGRPEPSQSAAKPQGIVQRLFGSLAFKVGAAVIVTEILVLTGVGIPLNAHHNADIDRRAVDRILIPGTLLQERVLSYASVADRRIMTDLLGEELIGGMVVGGNGNVFYSLDPRHLGQDVGAIPGIDPAWFDPSDTERQLIETRGDGETFLISITPLFTLDSKVPSLFAYIKTNTTKLTENKAAWRRLVFIGALAVVLTTSLIIFMSFQMLIFRRIVRSVDFVERVREGDLETRVATPGSDEFGTLERGMNEMVVNIKRRQEQRDAMRADLALSEERYAFAVSGTADGIWDWNIATGEHYQSPRCKEILGYEDHEIENRLDAFTGAIHPDDRDRAMEAVRAHLEEHVAYDTEYRMRCKDGSYVWVQAKGQAVWDEAGTPLRMAGSISDITKRKQAEEALRESDENFRQLTDNIRDVFWMTDPDKNRMLYISPGYEEIWGRTRKSLYEEPKSFLDAIDPGDRPRVMVAMALQAQGTYDETYRIVRPDGSLRWIRDRAFPVRNESGQVYRIAGIAEDITELVEQNDQLRQAQKMEAVGQLTGGVAHDFNNLLAIISLNADFVRDGLEKGSSAAESLDTMTRVADRGAKLTHRLLAFSRQQTLEAKVTDANRLVTEMTDLLRRTLGATVEIETALADDLSRTLVDPNQLENAVLNLAVNARDAMPKGGKLTIETANVGLDEDYAATQGDVAPGEYVRLSVSDSGTGMAPEVVARVFEPFFTTKDVGRGTGLGLSMVYGFVKQSGGHITIYSKEGHGTTVHLYLPQTEAAAQTAEAPATVEEPPGRGETVLVVEDDAVICRLVAKILDGLGYRVLEAGDGAQALATLERTPGVGLLLSDVVLPGGRSGPEIVAEAQHRHPGLKSLFMSGYAPEGIFHQGRLPEGAALLDKPFTRHDLAQKVRAVLDG